MSKKKKSLQNKCKSVMRKSMIGDSFNLHKEFVTDIDGNKIKVILDCKEFEKLMAFLEDLYDLQTIEDRKNEPLIPHDQFVRLLKEDGLL